MNLKQRRILYILFILVFLTITPSIILYASGYKLGNGFKLQKTGIFIIDSKPAGAKIYLNNKLRQNQLAIWLTEQDRYTTTPAKIKNIIPGEYTVRVEKEGYWPWEKRLLINSGESTFAEDIALFMKNIPAIVGSGSYERLSFSPNQKYLIAYSDSNIALINLSNDDFHSSSTALIMHDNNDELSDILWSNNNENFIIYPYLFDINSINEPINLENIIGAGAYSLEWDDDKDKTIVYGRNDNIYNLHIPSKTIEKIWSQSMAPEFILKENMLYAWEVVENTSYLAVRQLDNDTVLARINLGKSVYKFINVNHHLINLYDKKRKVLYLVDPNNTVKPLSATIEDINTSTWVNSSLLLYANDFEIWLFNLDNMERTLLTRISEQIQSVMWHPSNNYVIYSTNGKIVTLELDQRVKYNITTIQELQDISSPLLSRNGSILYFAANIGRQEGIYKLVIQ